MFIKTTETVSATIEANKTFKNRYPKINEIK